MPETVYGYGSAEGEILPDSTSSFDSAAAGYGSDTVFSRVIGDRKLTSNDGKLPEPKLND
jgi:hypothetical protein